MCHITHKAEEVGDLVEELCLEAGLEEAGAGRQKGDGGRDVGREK